MGLSGLVLWGVCGGFVCLLFFVCVFFCLFHTCTVNSSYQRELQEYVSIANSVHSAESHIRQKYK